MLLLRMEASLQDCAHAEAGRDLIRESVDWYNSFGFENGFVCLIPCYHAVKNDLKIRIPAHRFLSTLLRYK